MLLWFFSWLILAYILTHSQFRRRISVLSPCVHYRERSRMCVSLTQHKDRMQGDQQFTLTKEKKIHLQRLQSCLIYMLYLLDNKLITDPFKSQLCFVDIRVRTELKPGNSTLKTGLLRCFVMSMHTVVVGQQIAPMLTGAKTTMSPLNISLTFLPQLFFFFLTFKPDRLGVDTELQEHKQTTMNMWESVLFMILVNWPFKMS